MYCRKCGKEFEGNFCPECATAATENNVPVTPVQIPRKKYKTSTIVLISIGILIFAGVMGLIFGEDDEVPVSVGSKSQTNSAVVPSSPKSAPIEKKTEYGINDPATYKNTKLTVTNVEKSSGVDFDKPKEGMEYVIVTVQYENIGEDRISYNPFDFEMQNSEGQINSQSFSISNNDTALSSGELAGGGKVSGTIIFEEPIGDTDLTLLYTGSLFSNSEKLTFKLQ